MAAMILFFMVIFGSPVFILMSITALIRHFMFKRPVVNLYHRYFTPYSYDEDNGVMSIILTVLFGSYGMLYANIQLGFIFFFVNQFFHFIVFSLTFFESNPPSSVVLILIFTRAMNVIVIVYYTNKRLKKSEEDLKAFVEGGELFNVVNKPHYEVDLFLPEEEREALQMQRYEEAKDEVYKHLSPREKVSED